MKIKTVLGILPLMMNLIFLAGATIPVYASTNESEAQQAITEKKFAAARTIYLKLYEDAPENIGHLLWVARLSAWLHEYPTALRYYDQAIQKQNNNMDALLGKAYVYLWQRKFKQASHQLKLAEKAEGNLVAWHIAMVNYYSARNEGKKAQPHLASIKLLDPQNPEQSSLTKNLTEKKAFQFQAGSELQATPYTPLANINYLGASYENQFGKIVGRFDLGRTSDKSFNRVGVEVVKMIGTRLWVRANANVAGKQSAFPRLQTGAGITYKLNARTAVATDISFLKLQEATIQLVNPSVFFDLSQKMKLQFGYYQSWESRNNAVVNAASQRSFLVKWNRELTKKLKLGVIYTNLQQNLNFDLGWGAKGRTHNLITGIEYSLTARMSAQVNYIRSYSQGIPSRGKVGFGISFR